MLDPRAAVPSVPTVPTEGQPQPADASAAASPRMTDPRFWVALAAVVGVVAAFLAAIYPGFWVLEVQILSEPLGLLFLGLLTLALADLWHRPSLGRAALPGRSPERLRSSDPNSSP